MAVAQLGEQLCGDEVLDRALAQEADVVVFGDDEPGRHLQAGRRVVYGAAVDLQDHGPRQVAVVVDGELDVLVRPGDRLDVTVLRVVPRDVEEAAAAFPAAMQTARSNGSLAFRTPARARCRRSS